jgi:hypothetical protein
MKYTVIPDDFKEKYHEKFRLQNDKQIKHLCKEDPTVFAYYMMGITLRLHQDFAIQMIINSLSKRIAFCWARQLGKSILLGVFLIWSTYYNKYPSTVAKITTSFIMVRIIIQRIIILSIMQNLTILIN